MCHAIRERFKIGLNRIINQGANLWKAVRKLNFALLFLVKITWMTNKLSYTSSWQFVFWDNEWYQVSLQPKYIDALMLRHDIVKDHARHPAKYLFSSNLRRISFIKPQTSHFARGPSTPTSFRTVINFVRVFSSSILLFSSNAFFSHSWSHHNGGIITFIFHALRKWDRR